MADARLIRFEWVASLAALAIAAAGCSDPPANGGRPRDPTGAAEHAAAKPPEYAGESWGKFHSKRFQVTIPLPDGKSWKIDDHRAPELVATHAPTSSKLTLLATQEEELMNRQRCEDRAQKLGWLPKASLMTTVEDEVHVGPEAYDSRVWVALDAAKADGSVDGHVFLFGAFLRRCLLVHLVTTVPSAKDEEVLAHRLVVGSARIVKALALDPLRTTDDAVVPRDKPRLNR